MLPATSQVHLPGGLEHDRKPLVRVSSASQTRPCMARTTRRGKQTLVGGNGGDIKEGKKGNKK